MLVLQVACPGNLLPRFAGEPHGEMEAGKAIQYRIWGCSPYGEIIHN